MTLEPKHIACGVIALFCLLFGGWMLVESVVVRRAVRMDTGADGWSPSPAEERFLRSLFLEGRWCSLDPATVLYYTAAARSRDLMRLTLLVVRRAFDAGGEPDTEFESASRRIPAGDGFGGFSYGRAIRATVRLFDVMVTHWQDFGPLYEDMGPMHPVE